MVLKCVFKLNNENYESFIAALESVDNGSHLVKKCKAALISSETSTSAHFLAADVILQLSEYISKHNIKFCIHGYINLSNVEIIDIQKKSERSPELVARLESLRKQEEQRQYNQMVASVSKTNDSAAIGSVSSELRSLDRHIVTVINFVLTVAGAFVFGYKAPQLLWGSDEVLPRLLLGIICGAAVFVADIYFIIVRGVE